MAHEVRIGWMSRNSNRAHSRSAATRLPVALSFGAVLMLGLGTSLLEGCGAGVFQTTPKSTGQQTPSIAVSPVVVTLTGGQTQQFTVDDSGSQSPVVWSAIPVNAGDAVGTITQSGVYTAPAGLAQPAQVTIKASLASTPTVAASATVNIPACTVQITPSNPTVTAGTTQAFSASGCGSSYLWSVNGQSGGSQSSGTISSQGVYVSPSIDPGAPVTITATSTLNTSLTAAALVTVANPTLAAYQGATYAQTLAGWNASLLPWIENLSGLTWDPVKAQWTPMPNWSAGTLGIAPNVYYLEEAIRPATRMAILHQDISLIEELAKFHTALLQLRTITLGDYIGGAPANSVIFIDGPSTARTFAWYEPYSPTQVRIRDCQTCNAQYLSTAARLIRAIAEMPAAQRTAPMLTFVQQFSGFLVSDQLIRMMYGTTAWSHWDNPAIPQPAVSAWTFLAATGYRPAPPLRFEAAMTDMELWMVASSAEALAADQAAPELNILDATTREKLQTAVTAGVAVMQARCHHVTAPDGADVLSAFAGDYDDHPDYAYAGNLGAAQPSAPAPIDGLGWDSSHAYRLPVIFRTLYETQAATGVTFPTRSDLVALGNTYVHLAYDGNKQLPGFSTFIDGWDGWFAVEAPDIPSGYPPSQYCQAVGDPDNCLTPGTLQGWGELAYVNPDLAALQQRLINLAYDDSATTAAFKHQRYYYASQEYSANGANYPLLMVYVAGDAAERLK